MIRPALGMTVEGATNRLPTICTGSSLVSPIGKADTVASSLAFNLSGSRQPAVAALTRSNACHSNPKADAGSFGASERTDHLPNQLPFTADRFRYHGDTPNCPPARLALLGTQALRTSTSAGSGEPNGATSKAPSHDSRPKPSR